MSSSPDAACWGVHLLVERSATRDPAAVAVREALTGRQVTYQELWDGAGAVASELRGRGVGVGSVVAVSLGRGVDLVVAALGITRCGAAYLPLDRHSPIDRWSQMISIAGATQAVIANPWNDIPPGAAVIAMAELPSASGFDDAPVEADRPACVNFTSGTTGVPKGVIVPHRAVHRLVTGAAFCPIAPGHRVGAMSNPAFDATTFEIWSTLTSGGTIVALPDILDIGLEPWLDLVAHEQISTMFLTTALFHVIAREHPRGLRSLHTLLVGGEQLEREYALRVLHSHPPARLVNMYGPTETTTFATFFDCTPESLATVDRVPVGYPLQDTWIDVVNSELLPVPDGEEGELIIGGPGVSLGYIRQPALTSERFVTDALDRGVCYRSGDIARRLPSGAVEVLGRSDRQVKLRGFRIELPEIERVLLASGLVDAAFVEKAGDSPYAFLTAFVRPRVGIAMSIEDLSKALRNKLATTLPTYMIPARWQVVDTLPLGPTGKVDRVALLRSLDASDSATPPHDAANN